MKTKVYLGIAIRIIALFGTGMLFSNFSKELHLFFGDAICKHEYGYHGNALLVDISWDWGSMHYWYFVMCIFLFILSLINAIVGSAKLITKHYPELK